MRRVAQTLGGLLFVGVAYLLWSWAPEKAVPSSPVAPGAQSTSAPLLTVGDVGPGAQELVAPSLPTSAPEVAPLRDPGSADDAPVAPRAPHSGRLETFLENPTRWSARLLLHDGAIAALHRAGSYTELAEGESLLTNGKGVQMFTQLNLTTGRYWVYPVRPGDFPLLDRTVAAPVDELLDPSEARALANEVATWFDGSFVAPSYTARDYLIAP